MFTFAYFDKAVLKSVYFNHKFLESHFILTNLINCSSQDFFKDEFYCNYRNNKSLLILNKLNYKNTKLKVFSWSLILVIQILYTV